jgi:hypothetical protein
MKVKSHLESGQALIIITFAIIGLVGITGLAIDGGMAFSDRRHAQNAADTAALAGALAKINAQKTMSEYDARAPMRVAALDRAVSNGYDNNLVTNTVEVYTCDEVALGATCAAPYAGDSNYVQVVIISNVDTFFAKVIGIPQVHNRVEAIALADDDDSGPLFGGKGVVAANPDCPNDGSLKITGNADITINGGGMLSNSDDACAVKCSTSAGTLTVPDGITTAGGDFTWGGDCQDSLNGTTSSDETQFDYHADIPDLPEPPECDSSDLSNYSVPYTNYFTQPTTGTQVLASYLSPGYYNKFPPLKDQNGNQLKSTLVMLPGVYCVDTVLKLVDQNLYLYGDDVTIWVRAGNGFNINGGVVLLYATNGSHAPYSPHGTSNSAYKGYLIIVEPDYSGAVTSCTLEGNAYNKYEGAIFAPHCDVTINGTSDTPPDGINSQIIGYNVTINGGANLTINYDSDENPVASLPPRIGIPK